MQIQRTKNARRNVTYGIFLKGYQILIPFFMRTVMIHQLGIEYAGLNNLFSSIFQVLNLAELGVGAALTSSMYKPIAEDDSSNICALLKLYKKCFNVIGTIVFALGILCLPFLKYLISGTIPDNLNLYILYLLYLVNTVLSYWLFSYKKSLIYAHQRTDINSKILIFTYTIQFTGQAFVLFVLRNYYLYLIASVTSQILCNLIAAKVVDKIYPDYRPAGELNPEYAIGIKKKVQGLITNKIGSVVLKSADSIVISAFLGLTILAVYQNYYFILTAVINMISVIFDACLAGIGNSLVVDDGKKNYNDFRIMTFIVGWLSCICCSCFLVSYQSFITIWVGEEYLMKDSLVICLIVYFFIYEIDQLVGTYKDAAGIWYKDRYRPLVTALVNLGLNVFLVQKIGLYGVLLSTVISLIMIGIPWLLNNVFGTLFQEESIKGYILTWIRFAVMAVAVSFVSLVIVKTIPGTGIAVFAAKLIIAALVPNLIMIPFYYKSPEFKRSFAICRSCLERFPGF